MFKTRTNGRNPDVLKVLRVLRKIGCVIVLLNIPQFSETEVEETKTKEAKIKRKVQTNKCPEYKKERADTQDNERNPDFEDGIKTTSSQRVKRRYDSLAFRSEGIQESFPHRRRVEDVER